MVLEISTVGRLFLMLTVKELLHKCQPGVGRWSKRANVVKECPLSVILRIEKE